MAPISSRSNYLTLITDVTQKQSEGLRARNHFKKLVAELEAKSGPKAKPKD
jgi:hypothetical protein